MNRPFFTSARPRFFSPLNSTRRELFVIVIKELYGLLHGPNASPDTFLDRDGLKSFFLRLVQSNQMEAHSSEEGEVTHTNDNAVVTLLISELEHHQWLEVFVDSNTLQKGYRFSAVGMIFGKTLWSFERPVLRTRARNMRQCRNSLEAYLNPPSGRADPDDLIDALSAAEQVMSDLVADIDHFRAQVQRIMREAVGAELAWEEFSDFIQDRFRTEFAARFTADSVELHLSEIHHKLDQIRIAPDIETREKELDNKFPRIASDRVGSSSLRWVLTRVEELIGSAVDSKMPQLRDSMSSYIRRIATLMRQAATLSSTQEATLTQLMGRLIGTSDHERNVLLEALAGDLAFSRIRLLDPSAIDYKPRGERYRIFGLTLKPKVDPEAIARARAQRAVEEYLSVGESQTLESLLSQMEGRPSITIADLRLETVPDVLVALNVIAAARGSGAEGKLQVRWLNEEIDTPYFITRNAIIEKI
jgi:hypothetical protein